MSGQGRAERADVIRGHAEHLADHSAEYGATKHGVAMLAARVAELAELVAEMARETGD